MDFVTVTYIQYISTIDETVSMATGCSQEQQPIGVRQVFQVVLAVCHEVFPAGTAGLHLTGGTHRRVRGRTSLGNRQALLYRYPHLLVYFLGSPDPPVTCCLFSVHLSCFVRARQIDC